MAPGDGRIVSYDYGCGAHSDIVVESVDHPATEHAFDTTGYDELGLAVEVDITIAEGPDDVLAEVVEADAVQVEDEAAAEPPRDDVQVEPIADYLEVGGPTEG
jgi:hypothetical protein